MGYRTWFFSERLLSKLGLNWVEMPQKNIRRTTSNRKRRKHEIPATKQIWGHVEKLGKGTRANYDPDKKTITFCFNRDPQTSSGPLKTLRELLIKELKELGYTSHTKYNGDVVADNIENEATAKNGTPQP